MNTSNAKDLMNDLILPTVLFAALGGMTWAVRGCSGYGGSDGCIFAGVTWGTAWWFISRNAGAEQERRYTSGWIILALAFGIGISGARGWMQWPSFFEGKLLTNYSANEWTPISRAYGFLWLFIAGMPWAGIGACMLAWCGPRRRTRAWHWIFRIACGVAVAYFARYLFDTYPQFFLPLYRSMESQYHDFAANPNLRRLVNDCRAAIFHLGFFLGFLAYEIGRRDWKNVTLISSVGTLNGLGWALCQNWKWAPNVWPNVQFNFWRCWESSGGISIGIALGIAYYLVNRPEPPEMRAARPSRNLNLERLGAYLGLLFGLGISIRCGLKGWANIYIGNEEYWSRILWNVWAPLSLLMLAFLLGWTLLRPVSRQFQGDLFPRAYATMWFVLITQNILAQLITGPHSNSNENAFCVYYAVLFIITGLIVHHYQVLKRQSSRRQIEEVRQSA